MRRTLIALALLCLAAPVLADDTPAIKELGPRLERVDYPYPVTMFPVQSQGQSLEMAYMDLKPEKPNGRTVVLLHGKNFCGPYWQATAEQTRRVYQTVARR